MQPFAEVEAGGCFFGDGEFEADAQGVGLFFPGVAFQFFFVFFLVDAVMGLV